MSIEQLGKEQERYAALSAAVQEICKIGLSFTPPTSLLTEEEKFIKAIRDYGYFHVLKPKNITVLIMIGDLWGEVERNNADYNIMAEQQKHLKNVLSSHPFWKNWRELYDEREEEQKLRKEYTKKLIDKINLYENILLNRN